jgi:dipeptidyl aminopeptidase/acylaminoacyl peptidase
VLSRHHQRADPRFASGGRYVAAVDYDAHRITFFETATGRVRTNIVGQELAVSADGKQLAVLLQTNVLFLDPVKLTEITRVACTSQLGGQPSFSPDGKWLACRSEAPRNSSALTRVTVVDVLQRRVIREIETDGEGRDGWAPVFFARGGRLLLTLRWGAQRTVVWDTSTWRQVTTFEGPPADGTVAAVSPDGMTFAMAGYGGKLHLWDLDRLEPSEPVELGAGDIFALAFDAEGRTLAAGATDGTIRLWNVPARQEVAVLRGHSSLVRSLEFSPDGRALASGSRDFSIRLWRAPSFEEINAAEGGASARP